MRRVLLALAVLALAAPAGAAAAGKPFTLDPDGHRPRVAVGPTGNGFFTWTTPAAKATDTFHYCRIAQTLKTCGAKLTYNGGNGDVEGGYALFGSGGRVLLLDARCCGTFYALKKVWSSTNGGTSFTGPVSPGHMDGGGDNIAGQAIYAPKGTIDPDVDAILTVSDVETNGVTFQATGTGAGTQTATANLGGPGGSYQGSLALRGKTLVAIYGTLGPDKIFWRKWTGGDPNVVSNWTAPQFLDTTTPFSTGKLVGGPSGLYVAYARGAVGHQRYVLRRFTGSGWGDARRISEIGSPSSADLVEDGTGVLHFAWQGSDGKLHYRYARSPANEQFTAPQSLGAESHSFLKLGVNSAGRGWATWDAIPGVRAIAIKPGEPPYTGPNKKTTKQFGSKTVTLRSPSKCVARGRAFVPRVSGESGVTIQKVVFRVDGDKRATVTDTPFTATLGTKGLASGAHQLKATVTAKFKKGGQTKTATKDLAASFAIC